MAQQLSPNSLEMPSEYLKSIIDDLIEKHGIKNGVTSVSKGSQVGDNYLGEIYRVIVTDERGQQALNLIVKMAPKNQALRDSMGVTFLYKTELLSYSRILPALYELQQQYKLDERDRFRYAKFHTGSYEPYKEAIVLEDLKTKGYTMYDRHMSYDHDHLCLCVKNLARYHAASMALKKHRPETYEEIVQNRVDYSEFKLMIEAMINKSRPLVVGVCQNEPYEERVVQFYDTIEDEFKALMDPELEASFNVLCHGDCWSNNFMFKYENGKVVDMIMVDWQGMRSGIPINDLSYMIFLGTSKEVRAKHYKEALRLYYDTLKHNLVKMSVDVEEVYSEDLYWSQIKNYMKIGLILAFFVLPFTQGEKGEAINMDDYMTSVEDGGYDTVPASERAKKRLKDLIEDCIDYGYL